VHGIITHDSGMQRLTRTVEKLAPSDATVLLLGESGTGKELLARALHDCSPRVNNRFVAINCAAIPETLLESELFGDERGAFTGAAKQTRGKIEYANGGTLFLDEVGDLPHALQAKLLRFLQERVVERIGGREEISVDVRIVCATHQNLKEMMQQGRFREDLYYRLSEVVLEIPALRDRQGDSMLLANAFLLKFVEQQGKPTMHFSEEAVQAIEAHAWPGNVRELENAVKRGVIMAEGNRIARDDLGLGQPGEKPEPINLRQVREEAERKAIVRALGRSDGNLVRAAELLGVSRPTLYDLLNRYGLKSAR
jgi:two-component system NtrC family response regulator